MDQNNAQGYCVCQVDGMGRGLAATRDFLPNEQITKPLKALVAALNDERLDDTCYNCMRWDYNTDGPQAAPPLLECPGCHRVKYCTEVSPAKHRTIVPSTDHKHIHRYAR